MNKYSSGNIDRMFVLVFTNVLKKIAHKCYSYIAHGTFYFWNILLDVHLVFCNVTSFRIFIEHSEVMFPKCLQNSKIELDFFYIYIFKNFDIFAVQRT